MRLQQLLSTLGVSLGVPPGPGQQAGGHPGPGDTPAPALPQVQPRLRLLRCAGQPSPSVPGLCPPLVNDGSLRFSSGVAAAWGPPGAKHGPPSLCRPHPPLRVPCVTITLARVSSPPGCEGPGGGRCLHLWSHVAGLATEAVSLKTPV